ncbi:MULTISPECIES: L-threonylcarbamoyladenylate synthase [Desulfosediminicola]|uniref:L-threonylcarbamoyladenylate synthase n=1 Tax=Desulfosediminicola TaxID=2886823 RepID=UPI0010AD19C9|nr:L-threonylcarbamoyladenylate synthase [Desulfosediminicola ganghwensis]
MNHSNKQSVISPSNDDIRRAVEAIRMGGVVAVPTETYYGLAVNPDNDQAIERLYLVKQRPKNKPILLLVSNVQQVAKYAQTIPKQYESLIEHYWPGPLTLVFPARPSVSHLLTGGTGTIGIRLTPNRTVCRIIDLFKNPITATSANPSRHEPARSAKQVHEAFGDKLAYVVDGGPADEGLGSTVVNVIDGILCIERVGRIRLPGLPLRSTLR